MVFLLLIQIYAEVNITGDTVQPDHCGEARAREGTAGPQAICNEEVAELANEDLIGGGGLCGPGVPPRQQFVCCTDKQIISEKSEVVK
jgi:hypothetical protein